MWNFRQRKYLVFGLLSMWVCGCSANGDYDSSDSVADPYSIAIVVKGNSQVASRTAVVDPDDNLRGKQHVTRVQLYIYEQDKDAADYTCVATEDVKWRHLDGSANGLETREQKYVTEYQAYEDGVNYLFLAMGFDDTFTGTVKKPVYDNANSVAAYGQPNSIANIGKKLSEEYFKLQEGAGVDLIAGSELFAGYRTFTKSDLKNGISVTQPIDLYRRVAGIVGYFKNLPKQIDSKDVASVQLRLYESQNTKAYFLPNLPDGYSAPNDVPDDEYVDFITSPYNNPYDITGRVIASYDVAEGKTEFSLSAYLLPVAASVDKGVSTLKLVMLSADGTELAARRILYTEESDISTRSGTGIIDKPDEEGDSRAMHYPIRANHFYHMGEKKKPIDLSGQTSDIHIEIDPVWDEYYGGSMDNEMIPPGIGIDKDWGEHLGGKLDGESQNK